MPTQATRWRQNASREEQGCYSWGEHGRRLITVSSSFEIETPALLTADKIYRGEGAGRQHGCSRRIGAATEVETRTSKRHVNCGSSHNNSELGRRLVPEMSVLRTIKTNTPTNTNPTLSSSINENTTRMRWQLEKEMHRADTGEIIDGRLV